MENNIPNQVIGAVSSVLADNYSGTDLDTLFMESGAPDKPFSSSKKDKCIKWLESCNSDDEINSLAVLGRLIQEFMAKEPSDFDTKIVDGQNRIRRSLADNQFSYHPNGVIMLAGANPVTKTLTDLFKIGDLSSVEAEFNRAINQLDSDPYAAITAASSIIEALCKTYIETKDLDMPAKQDVVHLWNAVKQDLGLNNDRLLKDDQQRMLKGLASLVDGIGSYRTHIGSAHGRGIEPPQIQISEARLAVNASHTLVVFIMERWRECVPA